MDNIITINWPFLEKWYKQKLSWKLKKGAQKIKPIQFYINLQWLFCRQTRHQLRRPLFPKRRHIIYFVCAVYFRIHTEENKAISHRPIFKVSFSRLLHPWNATVTNAAPIPIPAAAFEPNANKLVMFDNVKWTTQQCSHNKDAIASMPRGKKQEIMAISFTPIWLLKRWENVRCLYNNWHFLLVYDEVFQLSFRSLFKGCDTTKLLGQITRSG